MRKFFFNAAVFALAGCTATDYVDPHSRPYVDIQAYLPPNEARPHVVYPGDAGFSNQGGYALSFPVSVRGGKINLRDGEIQPGGGIQPGGPNVIQPGKPGTITTGPGFDFSGQPAIRFP